MEVSAKINNHVHPLWPILLLSYLSQSKFSISVSLLYYMCFNLFIYACIVLAKKLIWVFLHNVMGKI